MVNDKRSSKSIESINNFSVYNMCSQGNKSKIRLNLSLMKNTTEYILFMNYDQIYPREYREKIKELLSLSNEKYFDVKIPKNMIHNTFIEKLKSYQYDSCKASNDHIFQIKNSFLRRSIHRVSF